MGVGEILQSRQWHVLPTVGDGHCLIHAVITSWFHQTTMTVPKYDDIKTKIFLETIEHYSFYLPFMNARKDTMIHQMQRYLVNKEYNTEYGDIVPNILSNSLAIELIIIENNTITNLPSRHRVNFPVVIHKESDHYNGVYLMPCPSVIDVIPNKSMKANVCKRITYEASDLRAFQNKKYPIRRTVRKRLLALQIWKPTGNPNTKSISEDKNHKIPVRITQSQNRQCGVTTRHVRTSRQLSEVIQENRSIPNIIFSNITGALSNKVIEIRKLMEDFDGDIFSCIETWCTQTVPDSAIVIDARAKYNLFRRDRKDGRQHGGLACYVKSSIPVINTWDELDILDLETMWITLRPQKMPRNFTHITVGTVYHPPGSDDWKMTQHLVSCIDTIRNKYPLTGIVVCGDFNHMKDSYFKSSCNLKQLITSPTHGRSTIDLFYTNMDDLFQVPKHEPGIGLSHHQVIVMTSARKKKPDKPHFVERRKQGPKERSALVSAVDQLDWTPILRLQAVQDKVPVFEKTIHKLMNDLLPVKTVKVNRNDHPWVTPEFHALIALRQFHFKAGNHEEYRKTRNDANRMRKRLKRVYYEKRLKNLRTENPRQWWKDIKEISGTQKRQNNLQGLADSLCDGNLVQLAENINQAFQQVSAHMDPLPDTTPEIHEHVPENFIISEQRTATVLKNVNKNKAIGPDQIPNWLLKSCALTLAPVVCNMWNTSIQQGVVPQSWKRGDVCPLPKVNIPKDIAKHLRPITLSSQLSKCLESFPRKWILDAILPQMDEHQYGSVAHRSTVTALSRLVHEWYTGMERMGVCLRILFLDFQKAFDLVDHNIAIRKLSNMGVPSTVITWIRSFLTKRTQRVKIGNIYSEPAEIKAGVPQGTLLGPVTFLAHINNLQPSCNTIKYVDDTTVWEISNTTGSDSKIQTAADDVMNWCEENNMRLNVDKTKELLIYYGKTPLDIPNITIGGKVIEKVTSFKLLGVIFNDNLTWNDHISMLCTKASQRLYFVILLKRAGVSCDDMLQFFCSTIRSILEYACVVWHPGLTKTESKALENIQERALRIICPDVSYEEALTLKNLKTLAARRDEHCRQFFKDIQSESHVLNCLLPPKRNLRDLRTQRLYETPRGRTNRIQKSPINYGLFHYQ